MTVSVLKIDVTFNYQMLSLRISGCAFSTMFVQINAGELGQVNEKCFVLSTYVVCVTMRRKKKQQMIFHQTRDSHREPTMLVADFVIR